MSRREVERFLADLRESAALRAELKRQPPGLEATVAFARARGYDVSAVNIKAHLSELAGLALTDEQLAALAGDADSRAEELQRIYAACDEQLDSIDRLTESLSHLVDRTPSVT